MSGITSNQHGLVVVTGGSGYIAAYCIAQLIANGWRVRATVRSLDRVPEVRTLLAEIVPDASAIEFAEADLNADAGWNDAIAGADYVLHVASPVPTVNPKDDDVLLRPARDGTLRVLKAARDCGVKRVVLTSSTSAIVMGRGGREQPFTETDWSDETNLNDTTPYDRSKTIAERAAWAWHKAEGGTLELAAVNPSFVLGPVLGNDFSASILVIKKLMDRSLPGLPRFGFALVDVRDLARLHVLAMTSPSAVGQRFIGSGDFLWWKDISTILDAALKGERKVPKLKLPDFVVRLSALFDPVLRGRLYELGQIRRASSAKALRVLGWETRAASTSIVDTARSLLAHGVV